MHVAVIDIVFASIILILVIRCALRGFIEEFMSMAALVIGVLFAVLFFKPGAAFVSGKLGLNILPEVISFISLFLIAFIIVKILERILGGIIERIDMAGVDKGLGFALGLVEGLLVVSVALFVLSVQPLFDPSSLLKESLFARYLMPFVTLAGETAADALRKGK
jgi:membrane protein required for colicin V production